MPQTMTFGTFIAPYHRPGENPVLLFRRDMELIEWCDELGFDEAWVGEHHSMGWEMIADPALMIAALGERTKHIRLGAGVVSLPYHNPLMVADRFVQLDHMTRGRAMLGVGPGALVTDAVMMGIDPLTQRAKMDEALGVIIRLLKGEAVTHVSDWFELQDACLQLAPINGGIPIAVASTTSPAGTICAGKHGVGVLSLGAGLVGQKKNLPEYWAMAEEAAAQYGTTVDRREWRLVIRAHLSDSREQAIADVREGRLIEREYFRSLVGASDTTLEEEVADDTAIVGTPDDMIAALERLQASTGGFGGFLVLAGDWATRRKTLYSYELMARYVIPHFKGMLDQLTRSREAVIAGVTKAVARGVSIGNEPFKKAYEDAGREAPKEFIR